MTYEDVTVTDGFTGAFDSASWTVDAVTDGGLPVSTAEVNFTGTTMEIVSNDSPPVSASIVIPEQERFPLIGNF